MVLNHYSLYFDSRVYIIEESLSISKCALVVYHSVRILTGNLIWIAKQVKLSKRLPTNITFPAFLLTDVTCKLSVARFIAPLSLGATHDDAILSVVGRIIRLVGRIIRLVGSPVGVIKLRTRKKNKYINKRH